MIRPTNYRTVLDILLYVQRRLDALDAGDADADAMAEIVGNSAVQSALANLGLALTVSLDHATPVVVLGAA